MNEEPERFDLRSRDIAEKKQEALGDALFNTIKLAKLTGVRP